MISAFETTILADWIDYNGHMRDSYYGLVFSLAVDAFQDEIGFDTAYRESTGCTIYLLEAHTYFLREVKEGAKVSVRTSVLGADDKRFHLHMEMRESGETVAIGEFMEAHVRQRPEPKVVAMPAEIAAKLQSRRLSEPALSDLSRRSRAMEIRAKVSD